MDSSDEDSRGDGTDKVNLGKYVGDRNEEEQRHGIGQATLSNGDVYDGEYRNGKIS